MAKVADPSQELRFTRSAQALIFALAGIVFLTVTVILAVVIWTIIDGDWALEELPFPVWIVVVPLLLAGGCFYVFWHCLRHPYLILSPAGVEIFPFWRPVKNFDIIPWGGIADLEIDNKRLTLHNNKEHTGGVVLSLSPLNKKSRMLLQEAINGIITKRNS